MMQSAKDRLRDNASKPLDPGARRVRPSQVPGALRGTLIFGIPKLTPTYWTDRAGISAIFRNAH